MDEVGRMRRPVGLALLIVGSLALLGASKPLNPLVVRSSEATMPVPAECEEGLSQVPAPRVEAAPETQVTPAAIPAPPSRDLQVALANAQRALESSDRASFDDAVASVKALLSGYPTGEERRVAEEIVQIYDDAARIWTGQFESPFFSESSDAYRIASKYPGYAEAVRRQVFVDRDGNRFYPADETRDFLSRLAAEDLARLGVKVEPGQIARAPRPAAQDDDEVRPLPTVVVRTTPEVPVTTPARPSVTTAPAARPTTSPTRRPVARRSVKPSAPAPAPARAATPPPPDDLPAARPVVASAPAPSKPEPAVPAPTTSEPAPPVVETIAPTPSTTTEVAPSPDTAVTTTATTTIAPATPSTLPPVTTIPATQPAKTRSVLLSVILILIGVGVLVLLFRTAD